MSQLVSPPDIELWACRYLRRKLHVPNTPDDAPPAMLVSNRVPPDYDGSYPLITVRDDGGSGENRLVFVRNIGVTVRGWDRDDVQPCRDLAAKVLAFLTLMPDVTEGGSPVASVDDDSVNGPYRISDDLPSAAYYLTVGYHTVGNVVNV